MRLKRAQGTRVIEAAAASGLPGEILSRLQQELLDNGPPYCVADLKGVVTYANAAYRRIETSLQEIGESAPSSEIVATLQSLDTPVLREVTLSIDDREEAYQVEYSLLRNNRGKVAAVLGRYLPASAAAEAERARALAEERFSDLTRLVSDWVWETDRSLKLVYVSARVTEILGHHPRQMIGRRLDRIARQPKDSAGPRLDRKTRTPFRGLEMEMAHKNGGLRLFRLNGLPIYCQNSGEFQGYRGTAEDITELRAREIALHRAVDAAEAANRAKSEFLANISHELRTPLNAVIGFSELIKSEVFGPIGIDRYKNYVDDILDSGRHLLALINDILDVTRLESGNVVLNESRIVPQDLLHAALRVVEDRLLTSGHDLRLEIDRDLPLLRADAVKLKQILLNLLTNAIKFTPEDGRIEVRAGRSEDGGMIFSVRDTGIGIASEDREIALTPFRQVDNRLARKFEGTGLGLPIAKALTELHDGTLSLESKLGEGTKVTIHLPRTRVVETKPAEA